MTCARQRFGMLVLAVLVLGAGSGCVSQRIDGGTTIYTFGWWIAPAIILAGVVAAAAGWFLCEYDKRLGYGLLVGVPLALLLFIPALFVNRVTVDDNHFEVTNGWWWSPNRHSIHFDDLEKIDLYEHEHRTRRGTSTSYHIDCLYKSGKHERVNLDLLMQEAAFEIFDRAEQHGVIVPEVMDDDEEETAEEL
jgi:hypothetical protein